MKSKKTFEKNFKELVRPAIAEAVQDKNYEKAVDVINNFRLNHAFDEPAKNEKSNYWNSLRDFLNIKRKTKSNTEVYLDYAKELQSTGKILNPQPLSKIATSPQKAMVKRTSSKEAIESVKESAEGVENKETREGLTLDKDTSISGVVPKKKKASGGAGAGASDNVDMLLSKDVETADTGKIGNMKRARARGPREEQPLFPDEEEQFNMDSLSTEQQEAVYEEMLPKSPDARGIDPDDIRTQNLGKGRIDDTNLSEEEKERIRLNRENSKADPILDTPPATPMTEPVVADPVPASIQTSKNLNDQVITSASGVDVPRKIDGIDKARLISIGKNEAQLRADINYFFTEFPNELKNFSKLRKSVPKMNRSQLERFHKRIVAVLQPKDSSSEGKVGVVIDAEEYITRKINELMINKAVSEFKLPNLQPIGDFDNKKADVKDVGSYEIKRGPDGGLNSQREPVYRYIPTTQDNQVEEMSYNYDQKSKPNRISLPITKMRNLTKTAQRQIKNNPFTEIQTGHRLQVLL